MNRWGDRSAKQAGERVNIAPLAENCQPPAIAAHHVSVNRCVQGRSGCRQHCGRCINIVAKQQIAGFQLFSSVLISPTSCEQ